MNKQLEGFCIKGRFAQKVCNNQFCTQTSIMCDNETCNCHSKHQNCATIVLFSSLAKKLNIKQESFLPLKESLIEWYKKQIKYFHRLIQEAQKSIDSGEFIIDGDEGKLFQLLKGKKYQQVTSNLVYRAMANLFKQPKIDLKDSMSKLQKQIDQTSWEINKALKKLTIQKQINFSSNSYFMFSKSLHQKGLQVQDNLVLRKDDQQINEKNFLNPSLQNKEQPITNLDLNKISNKLLVQMQQSTSSDNSIVFISHSKLEQLHMMKGDLVFVKGKKRTLCVVLINKNIQDNKIKMNDVILKNSAVKIGDTVQLIRAQNITNFTKIHILPFQDTIQGFTGDVVKSFLIPYFKNQYRPLTKGDTFVVRNMDKSIQFKVFATEPKEYGIVGPTTVLFTKGQNLKRSDEKNTGCKLYDYRMSLLYPSLSNLEKSKVRFRILDSKDRSVFFGVYELKGETIKQVGGIQNELGEDKAVICGSDGYVYCHLGKQKFYKESGIQGINVGDVVEVSYDPQLLSVSFVNECSKKSGSIRYKQKVGNPMHFCVMLCGKNDKVQLIK